jgi:hypothetical protein
MTPPRDLGARCTVGKGKTKWRKRNRRKEEKKKDQSGCVKTQKSPKPGGKKGDSGESYRLAVLQDEKGEIIVP